MTDALLGGRPDAPVTGWKVGIVWWPGPGSSGLCLTGVGGARHRADRRYEVDDTARCALGHGHTAPEASCTCGFWSVPARADLGTTFDHADPTWADLEVESFGRVVVHERGLRSGRQRVLSVRVDDRCAECGRTAAVLGADLAGPVTPRCPLHRPSPITGWSAPIADVAAALGTEVRVERRPWTPRLPLPDCAAGRHHRRRRAVRAFGTAVVALAPVWAIGVLRATMLPERTCRLTAVETFAAVEAVGAVPDDPATSRDVVASGLGDRTTVPHRCLPAGVD